MKSHTHKRHFENFLFYLLIHPPHRHQIILQCSGDVEFPKKTYCGSFLGDINIQPAEER